MRWFVLVSLLVPAVAGADAPTDAELTACIGTKASWKPTVFAKLKEDMTPADAAKVLPGADQVSQFGFVTVKAEGCAGATEYELYFRKDKDGKPTLLTSARIGFDPALTADEEFYQRLVKVCVAKFGKAKPADVEQKLVTWANRKFKTAQLVVKQKKQLRLEVRL